MNGIVRAVVLAILTNVTHATYQDNWFCYSRCHLTTIVTTSHPAQVLWVDSRTVCVLPVESSGAAQSSCEQTK